MIFISITLGITLIITQSTLFSSFREMLKKNNVFFYDLFSCPMCLGFWVGIFVFNFCPEEINVFMLKTYNFIDYNDFMNDYKLSYILYNVYVGAIISFINWLSHNILVLLILAGDYIKGSLIIAEYQKIQQEFADEDELPEI